MKKYKNYLFGAIVVVAVFFATAQYSNAAKPSDYGLREGDLISAVFSDDPDVYIINEHGYKRLFLNPAIFKFYSHLGGFVNVKLVTPEIRDAFITSGYFRNCESGGQEVYGVEVNNEDAGVLRWINTSGEEAVNDDPEFFKKVFCINNNEFNWYPKGQTLKSVKEVPPYVRTTPTPTEPVDSTTPIPTTEPTVPPVSAVTVTSPNGGEKFGAGGSYKITWTRNWMPDGADGRVDIFFNRGGINTMIASKVKDPSYIWPLPDITARDDYRVVITSLGFGGDGDIEAPLSDSSDKPFSIVDGTVAVSLSSGTPLSKTVSLGQKNVDFLRFNIQNEYNKEIKIASLSIIQQGTAAPSDISRLYWYDQYSNGALIGTGNFQTSGSGYNFASIGNDDQGCFPDCAGILTIPAKSTRTISVRADISPTATPGATSSFVLLQDFYVYTTDRLHISGDFPVRGYTMTISSKAVPTVNLVANPTYIISEGKPGKTTLSWNSNNATSCLFEKQVLPISGDLEVTVSSSVTYTISCVGPGGTGISNPVEVKFITPTPIPTPIPKTLAVSRHSLSPSGFVKQNNLRTDLLRFTINGPVGENVLNAVFTKIGFEIRGGYAQYLHDLKVINSATGELLASAPGPFKSGVFDSLSLDTSSNFVAPRNGLIDITINAAIDPSAWNLCSSCSRAFWVVLNNLTQTSVVPAYSLSGLPVHGHQITVASPELVSVLSFSRDLAVGLRGDDVKHLQSLLVNEVNYPAHLITGYFGSITQNAVKKLQEKYGIKPAQGYFGKITRQIINALILNK